MSQEIAPEALASTKSYWDSFDERIAEEAANGNENTLDITIAGAIWATAGQGVPYQPRQLDYEVHSFWRTVLLAAQNFNMDNPKQDALLRCILAAREMGALTRGSEKAEEKLVLARTSNGQRLWVDLPFLVQDFFQTWRAESMNMSIAQRRNLASFISRLASVGVCGDMLTGCALLLFRDTFETPRRLTSADPGIEVPVEDLLPAVAVWIEFAPNKLNHVVYTSFNEFGDAKIAAVEELARRDGVSQGGFYASRWAFWKKRLAEISRPGQVPEAAHVLQMINDNEDWSK